MSQENVATTDARRSSWLAVAIVLVGFGLRTRAYLADRSLWLDEAQLALNILHRAPRQLLGALDYNQAAPAGFLLLEKLATRAFGTGELALRLVPFLASLIALVVLHRVVRRRLPVGEGLVVLAVAAFSGPLIYYGGEVKQYSTDVLAGLVITWAGLAALDAPEARRRLPILALAGALGVWLSHAAVFCCAAVGLTLLAAAWREGARRRVLEVALVITTWVVSFAGHYFTAMTHVRDNRYLWAFWSGGFPVLPPHNWDEICWWPRTLVGIFSDPGGLTLSALAAVAGVAGVLRLFRLDWRYLGMVLGPALCTLTAAAVRVFPFPTSGESDTEPLSGRILLFLVPALYVAVAAGLGALWRSADGSARLVAATMAVFLGMGLLSDAVAAAVVPPTMNELRGLVDRIARRVQPGDVIVVNEKGRPILDYYVERATAESPSLASTPIVELLGKGQKAALQGAIERVAAAPRVWLLYAHHPSWRTVPDEDFVRSLLAARRTLSLEKPAPGAALTLYSLP